MTTYTIQSRDNLTKIAKAHNTTVEKLAKLNNITDPNRITAGDTLIFEEPKPAVSHTTAAAEEEEENIGFDTFTRTSKKTNNGGPDYSPLLYGAGALALWEGGKYIAPKVKNAAGTVKAYGWYGKENAKQFLNGAAQKSKKTAQAVRNFVTQKTKHAAKSAELHYAFGKDAVKQEARKAVQKGKTAARYTRFIGNTKVAPKLIKGAGRFAGPLAAVYGAIEVKKAYDEGGEKAAVKQAVKTGGGLAGGWAGAKAGAAIGSFAGPIGTVAGGIIGGVAGYLLGEKLFS